MKSVADMPTLTAAIEKADAEKADACAPIGLFDSGLGGLTVARQMQAVLPYERMVYVADQAHVPYGGRELGEVCGFACGISEALLRMGCKAVVMACNISSATALRHVQAEHPHVPVLGMIEPGAKQAAQTTRNGRIGVLATAGTVQTGAYTRALRAQNPDLIILEVACPALVPLVESEQENTPMALDAAHSYLAPMLAADVDTVVLGCTHYPFLLPSLEQAAPAIRFVDPALAVCREMQALLAEHNLSAPPSTPRHLLTTTGDTIAYAHQLTRFLPHAAQTADIAPAHWHGGTLGIHRETR